MELFSFVARTIIRELNQVNINFVYYAFPYEQNSLELFAPWFSCSLHAWPVYGRCVSEKTSYKQAATTEGNIQK